MNDRLPTPSILMIENGRGGYSKYTRDLCHALVQANTPLLYLANTHHCVPQHANLVVRPILHSYNPLVCRTKVGRLVNRALATRRNIRIIKTWAEQFMPNVVHVQSTAPLIDVPALSRLRKYCPVVLTAHDIIPHCGIKRPSRQRRLRALYNSADALIVHSVANKDAMISTFGISPDTINVIPHGAHIADPRLDKKCARKSLAERDNTLIVLFAGNIRSNKRLDLLLEAFPQVLANNNQARLVIAGMPRDISLRQIHGRLAELGISDATITNCCWLSDLELDLYLAASDVCVLPYTDFHAQSGILMRALSQSTPVLVTEGGSLAEVVTAGNVGLTFAVNDSYDLAKRLIEMLANEGIRQRFATNAKILVETKYDWRLIASQTIDLYRKLAG